MSLEKVTMYRFKCDGCGNWCSESYEIVAWDVPEGAETAADAEGWLLDYNGKDYCADCIEWNEDETELVPKNE